MTTIIYLKKRDAKEKSRGFTSLELIATVSILLLVSVIVIYALMILQVTWKDSITISMLQNQAKNTMQAIAVVLREADPSDPLNQTVQVIIPNPQNIQFAIPVTTDSDSITSWSQVNFARNSSTNEVTKNVDGASTVIGRQISDLTFSQEGDIIKVDLTASGVTADGKLLSVTLLSEVAMRN